MVRVNKQFNVALISMQNKQFNVALIISMLWQYGSERNIHAKFDVGWGMGDERKIDDSQRGKAPLKIDMTRHK